MNAVILLTLSSIMVTAALAGPPASYRNVIGKTLVEEHFDTATLPTSWTVQRGTWAVVEGAVEGREKAEDRHVAIFLSKQALPDTLVIKADVRFDGARNISLQLYATKGHLCAVIFTPSGFTLGCHKDTLAKVEQTFTAGEWYHVTIEITGDEMLVWTDTKHVGYGRHDGLARKKAGVGIGVAMASGRIDNLVISSAEPDPAWAEHKLALGIK